jgi:hypothetical protein
MSLWISNAGDPQSALNGGIGCRWLLKASLWIGEGNARNTLDPGGGYLCETDPVARYVAITTKGGTLVHEGTFYKSLGAIEKAGITASLVPGSHPWGRKADGF